MPDHFHLIITPEERIPLGGDATSPTKKGNISNRLRYCIALKNALFFRQPSGVELCPIFDKRATALSSQPYEVQASPGLRSFDSRLKPLAHDDSLWRGEIPPRQAKIGLVGDPGFAPRGFNGLRPSAEPWVTMGEIG
jgi:hypothetical protein